MGTVIDLSEMLVREQRENLRVRTAVAALDQLKDQLSRGVISEETYKAAVRHYLKDITDFYDITDVAPQWKGKHNDD